MSIWDIGIVAKVSTREQAEVNCEKISVKAARREPSLRNRRARLQSKTLHHDFSQLGKVISESSSQEDSHLINRSVSQWPSQSANCNQSFQGVSLPNLSLQNFTFNCKIRTSGVGPY